MKVGTDVALVGGERRSRVQAHPHPDRTRREPFANRPSCVARSRRSREGNEEGVSLGVNLDTAETCASLADQTAVLGERLRIPLGPELLEQPRRPLNVAEEKGDRSRRKDSLHKRHHASRIQCAQSGLRGAPRQGRGIVGCAGGAGCPCLTCFWFSACSVSRMAIIFPLFTGSTFGVVARSQLHGDRLAGTVFFATLCAKQLFTDCFVPKIPPS